MDCSATHRSLGVHTTFVRSVDLDEWTQRQIDAMRLGGNANARKYFREKGMTDMHAKIEKKYTSKAARNYRAELERQVEIAAAQRGEGTTSTSTAATTGSLLESLTLQDMSEQSAASANYSKPVTTAVPTAKKASELSGAKGKLVVTPPSSGNLSGGLSRSLQKPSGSLSTSSGLRKPAGKSTTMSSKMMLKMPSKGGGKGVKLGVGKLSVSGTKLNGKSGDDDKMADFDDMEKSETTSTKTPAVAAQPKATLVVPQPKPAVENKEPEKPKSSMETSVNRLKSMNKDFFSGI